MPKQARREPGAPESARIFDIRTRITKRRKVLNLSQDELGRRLGISHVAVSAIEGGGTALTIERIEGIAEALECTTDYLLGTEHDTAKLICIPMTAFTVMESYAFAYALALAEQRVQELDGLPAMPESRRTFDRAMHELRQAKLRWYRLQARAAPSEEQPNLPTHPDVTDSSDFDGSKETDEQPAEPATSTT
jgi:transcriptional regulator with XRE-family HTH domain